MSSPRNSSGHSIATSDTWDENGKIRKEPSYHTQNPHPEPPQQKSQQIRILLMGILFNIMILFISVSILMMNHGKTSNQHEMRKARNSYSPLYDRINLPSTIKPINGTLFPGSNPSIARQMPNPSADAIWSELELTRTIPISSSDILALGKDPSKVAKLEDSYWHLGQDAYMAQIDIFHRLHCLNSLRKLAYPEYYANTTGSTQASSRHPHLWFTHVNHCVDILMQNIMCNADLSVYTMQWMEGNPNPFPDFGVKKQCWDFEALVQWRRENSLDVRKWIAMEKPEGFRQVPRPQELLDLYALEKMDSENGGGGHNGGGHVH